MSLRKRKTLPVMAIIVSRTFFSRSSPKSSSSFLFSFVFPEYEFDSPLDFHHKLEFQPQCNCRQGFWLLEAGVAAMTVVAVNVQVHIQP